jgi:predicted nucleic acid-binding protein
MVEKVYWDSDCFLGFLQEDEGKVDLCGQVLQAAEDGDVLIITSALTLAEVLAVKKKEKIQKERRDDVINFFKNDYIVVRNLDRRISEIARDIVWDNGILPKDACHVATTIFLGLDKLHTFDKKLIAKTGQVGEPRIIIEEPSVYAPKLNLTVVGNDKDKKTATN